MNTSSKLKEALAELERQRGVLDSAIASIRNAVALIETNAAPAPAVQLGRVVPLSELPQAKPSYIDDAVQILTPVGKPLHVNDLVAKIKTLGKPDANRGSVESSLIRHIQSQGDKARVARFAPSVFGLSAWKSARSEAVADHQLRAQ